MTTLTRKQKKAQEFKSKNNSKIEEKMGDTLDTLVKMFEEGTAPVAIAIASFPSNFGIPCEGWSLSNRIIMFINGYEDARSFNNWRKVGRKCKKGGAFYIFKPVMKKIWVQKKDSEGKLSEEATLMNLPVAFAPHPVWPYENTEGKPLEDMPVLDLTKLPFVEKAIEWGIDVKAVRGNANWHGAYIRRTKFDKKGKIETEQIHLASPDEKVFLHELAHAAHKRVSKNFDRETKVDKEVVAELAAAAIAQIVGIEKPNVGESYNFIRNYANMAGKSPGMACLDVISDVEKVIKVIFE